MKQNFPRWVPLVLVVLVSKVNSFSSISLAVLFVSYTNKLKNLAGCEYFINRFYRNSDFTSVVSVCPHSIKMALATVIQTKILQRWGLSLSHLALKELIWPTASVLCSPAKWATWYRVFVLEMDKKDQPCRFILGCFGMFAFESICFL